MHSIFRHDLLSRTDRHLAGRRQWTGIEVEIRRALPEARTTLENRNLFQFVITEIPQSAVNRFVAVCGASVLLGCFGLAAKILSGHPVGIQIALPLVRMFLFSLWIL